MRRHKISNEQWAAIKGVLPGKAGGPGRTAADNRLFVNAVSWITRTGSPRRDLLERFGPWNSAFRRFTCWCRRDVWGRVLESLGSYPELFEHIARLDRRSSAPTCGGSARGQSSQALGRFRGGFSTKIHAVGDGESRPVKLHLRKRERHDATCAECLLEDTEPEFVIGDKANDSDPLRDKIRAIGAKPAIPSRRTRRKRRHDRRRFKLRNMVERFMNRIAHCRRVATRYEKLTAIFRGFVQFASALTLPINVHTTWCQRRGVPCLPIAEVLRARLHTHRVPCRGRDRHSSRCPHITRHPVVARSGAARSMRKQLEADRRCDELALRGEQ